MTLHREKELNIIIPIKKIIGSLELEPFQQLQIQCTQLIDYVKLQNNHYQHDPFLLNELEIIIDAGNIDVYCVCNINGINYNLPLDIIRNALLKVLSNHFGFKPRLGESSSNKYISTLNHSNIHTQVYLQKATMTTPLAYLLGQQTPHGKLLSLWIKIDIESKDHEQLKDSLIINIDEDGNEMMNNMNQLISTLIERSFIILFCQYLSQCYPLIFSPSYVEKLNASTKYIPNIARSLERFFSIADTSSRMDFKEKIQQSLNITKDKIKNLYNNHHHQQQQQQQVDNNIDYHLWDDLVVSLYYSTKNSSTLRNHKNVTKINE